MPFRYAPGRGAWAAPVGWLRRSLHSVRALGFWLAVALPLVYLPLVVAAPAAFGDPPVLAAVVLGNLAAIVVGHGHDPSPRRSV